MSHFLHVTYKSRFMKDLRGTLYTLFYFSANLMYFFSEMVTWHTSIVEKRSLLNLRCNEWVCPCCLLFLVKPVLIPSIFVYPSLVLHIHSKCRKSFQTNKVGSCELKQEQSHNMVMCIFSLAKFFTWLAKFWNLPKSTKRIHPFDSLATNFDKNKCVLSFILNITWKEDHW